MTVQKVSFFNSRGLKIVGILDGEGDRCAIISSHFTGFKEVKHYFNLAKTLSDNGICALRFDFSDCIGESEGTCEEMSVTNQTNDIISAIDFLEEKGISKIGIMGHSLGGLVAINAAANDNRIKALVSAAAPAKLEWDTLFKEKEAQWKNDGYITFPSWKRGKIRINYGFYLDLKKLDATKLVQRIKAPILVIHPENDELVSIVNSQGIYENANDPKNFIVIKGSDHMFSKEEHESELIGLTLDWFKKWL